MTFERSVQGQRNRNLFLGSDLIVYVEGGDETQGVVESFDILFWSTVFGACRPGIKIRLIPKGAKRNVLSAAATLIGSDATGVCAAVDVDYDRITGRLVDDPRIIYTYGYSFENDAMAFDALVRAFYVLCPRCPQEVNVSAAIQKYLSTLAVDARWLVRADLLACLAGHAVIERRRCPKYLMSAAYGAAPQISREMVLSDVIRANVKPRDKVSLTSGTIDVLRDLVGHLYAEYGYRLVSHLHNVYSSKSKITKDGFYSVCIQAFGHLLATDSGHYLASYYRPYIEKVPI